MSVGICRVRICGAYFDFSVTRTGERGVHRVEQEETATAGLLQRFAHDLPGDAADLDVHLQGGDAFAGSGDLEVHVAVVVFRSGNVGQDGVVIAFLDQAHGDTGDRCLQRNARVHQRKTCAADRGHRRGAVRLENVRDDADRVGRFFFAGQDGADGALGQCAVADFAAADAGHAARFTDRERREVVVQHEALLLLAFEGFEALRVVVGAECCGDQGLRLAAGEERRAVGAGQHASLNGDGANLVEGAAVGTDAVLGDLLAEDALAQRLVVVGHLLLGGGLFGFGQFLQLGGQLVLDLLDERVALGLGVGLGVERVLETIANLARTARRSRPDRIPER